MQSSLVYAYELIPEYLCKLGLTLYQQGKVTQALEEFKKALAINPEYKPALKYINIT